LQFYDVGSRFHPHRSFGQVPCDEGNTVFNTRSTRGSTSSQVLLSLSVAAAVMVVLDMMLLLELRVYLACFEK
jgi:hypothetical protein